MHKDFSPILTGTTQQDVNDDHFILSFDGNAVRFCAEPKLDFGITMLNCGSNVWCLVERYTDLEALRRSLADGGEAAVLVERVIRGHSVLNMDGGPITYDLTQDADAAHDALKGVLRALPKSADADPEWVENWEAYRNAWN